MQNKKSLTYIIEKFPSPTEYFVLNEIVELEKQGYSLTILVLKKQKHFLHLLDQYGVRSKIVFLPLLLHRLPFLLFFINPLLLPAVCSFIFKAPISALLHSIKNACYAVYFCNKLKAFRPRHIHAHFAFIATDIASIFAEMLKIRFSFTAHAQDIYTNKNLTQHLHNARFAVTCTEYNKHHINSLTAGRCAGKLHSVYHGVCIENWEYETQNEKQKAKIRILSVARLVEKKGLIYLLKAIELLLGKGLDVSCTIIGEGPLHKSLQEYVNSKGLGKYVEILPYKNQHEIKQFYYKSTVFVLPCVVADNGDRDGLPNVIAEAMLCGLPVISTAVSAIPEIIQHNVTGLLVEEKDERAVCEAIKRIATESKLRDTIVKNAKQLILTRFNVSDCTKQLTEVFDRYLMPADLGN